MAVFRSVNHACRHIVCSTPFGIRDHGGQQGGAPRLRSSEVLNAFRHQRSWRRIKIHLECREATGAQRLSASEIMAVASPQVNANAKLTCSTPFGIRDHGGFCILLPFHVSCRAQRLSASEIMAANPSDQDPPSPSGAQRLSASEIMAVRVGLWLHGLLLVLNAFRHQRSWRTAGHFWLRTAKWCSTPFGIRDHGGRVRANRMHVKRECSTPFGIRDHGG